MATQAIPQVLDTSVDAIGLSILSATMTTDEPRRGSMYDAATLAAGVPMWFHPLQDGRFVALFGSYWNAATVGAGGPQSYTDHTEVASPARVIVAPPTGHTGSLSPIPTRLPGDDLTLNGAASRIDFLFTVGSLAGSAIVQHHRVTQDGVLVLAGEESIPPTGGVLFDKGCYLETAHLVIFGTDNDNALYQARRSWARIGGPAVPDSSWEYRGAKGWLPDPGVLEPIGLSTAGPVSVAKFKDRLLVSTVGSDGSSFSATVYGARQTDPFAVWKPLGPPLDLGDTGTYLGGGLYLQPQLGRNPAFPLDPGASTGIPYVSSTRVISGDEHAISTAWGLWSI